MFKDRNYMIISINTYKEFDRVQHSFIEVLKKI